MSQQTEERTIVVQRSAKMSIGRWWLCVLCVSLLSGCQGELPGEAGRYAALLRHKDPLKRQKGARELSRFSRLRGRIVPLLVRALRDRFPGVRLAAVRSLSRLGPPSAKVYWQMAEATETMRLWARVEVVQGLRRRPKEAVSAYIKGVQGQELRWRRSSAWMLGQLAEISAASTLRMEQHKLITKRTLAPVLKASLALAAPVLISALNARSAAVRRESLRALQRFNRVLTLPPTIWLRLVKIAEQDKQRLVQEEAIKLLTQSRSPKPAQLLGLLRLLKAKDRPRRLAAIRALGRNTANDDNVAHALFPFLKSPHWEERQAAIKALHQMGVATFPLLLHAWKRAVEGTLMRRVLIKSLAKARLTLSRQEREVQSILFRALKDKDMWVRRAAREALALRIKQDKVRSVGALVALLKHPHEEVRWSAVWLLGNMGARAQESHRHVMPLLRDKQEKVRLAALGALGRLGCQSVAARAAVKPFLRAKKSEVLRVAIAAVLPCRQAVLEAKGFLEQLSRHPQWPIRRDALGALGRHLPAATWPLMMQSMCDKSLDVRTEVAAFFRKHRDCPAAQLLKLKELMKRGCQETGLGGGRWRPFANELYVRCVKSWARKFRAPVKAQRKRAYSLLMSLQDQDARWLASRSMARDPSPQLAIKGMRLLRSFLPTHRRMVMRLLYLQSLHPKPPIRGFARELISTLLPASRRAPSSARPTSRPKPHAKATTSRPSPKRAKP